MRGIVIRTYEKNRSGMTIMELLLTIMILGMVISLAAAGIGMVRRQYDKARLTYDARVLADEIAEEMVKQLRFAQKPAVEEEKVVYYDSLKNKECQVSMELWGMGEDSHITDSNGLTVCRLKEDRPVFAWDDRGRCIVISFGICDRDGRILAEIDDVKVRILNP